MADQISRFLSRTRQRAHQAAHAVATLEADIRRLTAIPSPGEERLIGLFRELLTLRIAERDEAWRHLAMLEAQQPAA